MWLVAHSSRSSISRRATALQPSTAQAGTAIRGRGDQECDHGDGHDHDGPTTQANGDDGGTQHDESEHEDVLNGPQISHDYLSSLDGNGAGEIGNGSQPSPGPDLAQVVAEDLGHRLGVGVSERPG